MTLAALFMLFRSWRITVLTLGAVLVSVLWTLGLYSLMGFSFNVLSSMLVPLVVVLAIADDVHIVQHYTEAFERTGNREEAFVTTVAYVFLPLLAAGGTTALGMLSLATSHVHAVRSFGIGAAVGVMTDLGDLDRPGADAAGVRAAAHHAAAAGALADRADAGGGAHHVAPARPGDGRGGAPGAACRSAASCACGSTPTTSTSSRPGIRCRSRPG